MSKPQGSSDHLSEQLETHTIKQRATLTMVAQKAGVSPSTVSRILNGTAQVSAEKKALVNAVIEEMGFRPDPAARSLAGGRTMSIGVLTQFIDSPYYGEALRGIEDELHKANYVPLFVSGHWNEEEEKNRLFMLQERKVDGIIVLTGKLTDTTLVEMAAKIPVVVTGRRLVAPGLFSIDFDNAEGAGLAMRHLHALGHNRVAFISGPLDHPDATERMQGFRSEAEKKGMALDEDLTVFGDYQEAGGYRAMNSLLENRTQFTAVFAANDQMAYGARLALHRAGLRVPEDISLIGFDDLPHSAFTLPPLTSVRQSVYEIGISAARAMMDMLNKQNPPSTLVAAELVVRESTRINRR
jgi:LacI family transcriptional regulator